MVWLYYFVDFFVVHRFWCRSEIQRIAFLFSLFQFLNNIIVPAAPSSHQRNTLDRTYKYTPLPTSTSTAIAYNTLLFFKPFPLALAHFVLCSVCFPLRFPHLVWTRQKYKTHVYCVVSVKGGTPNMKREKKNQWLYIILFRTRKQSKCVCARIFAFVVVFVSILIKKIMFNVFMKLRGKFRMQTTEQFKWN